MHKDLHVTRARAAQFPELSLQEEAAREELARSLLAVDEATQLESQQRAEGIAPVLQVSELQQEAATKLEQYVGALASLVRGE